MRISVWMVSGTLGGVHCLGGEQEQGPTKKSQIRTLLGHQKCIGTVFRSVSIFHSHSSPFLPSRAIKFELSRKMSYTMGCRIHRFSGACLGFLYCRRSFWAFVGIFPSFFWSFFLPISCNIHTQLSHCVPLVKGKSSVKEVSVSA